jgi:hypothetical protein
MEYNLVTRVIFGISGTIICCWFVTTGEPSLVWAALGTASTLKTVIYNARQPHVRKAWAVIGDRERA